MSDDATAAITALFEVMAQLRRVNGCPWDREQTHQSLLPYLLEETYETIDAVAHGTDQDLAEELGDLLVEVAMQCAIASERGAFGLAEVARMAEAKMVRRHPHVFAGASASTSEELLHNWEAVKTQEKPGRASALDGIPRALPALARAASVQRRAARANPDFAEPGPGEPSPQLALTRLEDAKPGSEGTARILGDLLFFLAGRGRSLGLDPEGCLRESTDSWERAFRAAESERRQGVTSTELPLDGLG